MFRGPPKQATLSYISTGYITNVLLNTDTDYRNPLVSSNSKTKIYFSLFLAGGGPKRLFELFVRKTGTADISVGFPCSFLGHLHRTMQAACCNLLFQYQYSYKILSITQYCITKTTNTFYAKS